MDQRVVKKSVKNVLHHTEGRQLPQRTVVITKTKMSHEKHRGNCTPELVTHKRKLISPIPSGQKTLEQKSFSDKRRVLSRKDEENRKSDHHREKNKQTETKHTSRDKENQRGDHHSGKNKPADTRDTATDKKIYKESRHSVKDKPKDAKEPSSHKPKKVLVEAWNKPPVFNILPKTLNGTERAKKEIPAFVKTLQAERKLKLAELAKGKKEAVKPELPKLPPAIKLKGVRDELFDKMSKKTLSTTFRTNPAQQEEDILEIQISDNELNIEVLTKTESSKNAVSVADEILEAIDMEIDPPSDHELKQRKVLLPTPLIPPSEFANARLDYPRKGYISNRTHDIAPHLLQGMTHTTPSYMLPFIPPIMMSCQTPISGYEPNPAMYPVRPIIIMPNIFPFY